MIDVLLAQLIDSAQPRMNHDLCNGLSSIQMGECEDYINQVIRGAAESFPDGLEYVSYRRCTPSEEYREITRPPKPKRSFELSESNVYMVKYKFRYKGVDIRPRFIMLPYITDGGIIHLKGTQYKVSPVLGGRIFNIEKGKVFITTPRTPMAFDRTAVSLILNNVVIQTNVVHSMLYNMLESARSKLSPTLIHYMLSSYGLKGMMKNLFNVKIKVGLQELDKLTGNKDWYVYRSRQLPPLGRAYRGRDVSEIRIAIKKEDHNTIMNSILGAVFYIIDQCPEAVTVEDINNPELWLRLLSRFIFKVTELESTEYDKMLSHLDSVKRSMDPLTRRILLQDGIPCNTIFDLFKYIVLHLHDMVIHHDVGSMYNMELTTVKHLCYHIVYNINQVMYELKRLNGDRITAEKITSVMDNSFRRDKIFTVSKHGELSADDISADCKPFGATCNIVSQSKAATAGRLNKHSSGINDPAMLLHASQVEVGTYLMISKADASGRSKANPFMYFSDRHFVSPRPILEETVENFRKLITKS